MLGGVGAVSRRAFLVSGFWALAAATGAGAGLEVLARQARRLASPSPAPKGAASDAPATAGPVAGVGPGSSAVPGAHPAGAPGQAAPWPTPVPGHVPPDGFALIVPVLMYHRIVPPEEAGDSLPGLVVDPTLFAAQLGALRAAGWRGVTVAQLAHALQFGRPLPPRTLAISIDDGWDDGYVHALPALQQAGFSATYYVIGRRIGAGSFLSAAHLRALVAAGMEVGDHTFDHIALPALSGTRQAYEIGAASARIADVLGHAPVTFSYPAGAFDPAVEEAVQEAGFGLAVTTEEGAVQTWAGRFSAPRVRVSPSMSPTTVVATLERWA